MVNIAKRMRGLKTILGIRNGPGAALLPPAPAPQLVHVHLRYPLGPYEDAVHGARRFWRNHLRRLKFHNPALPITVDHAKGDLRSPMLLTLQFEHKDQSMLEAVPGSVGPKVTERVKEEEVKELSEEEKEILAKQQNPNFRHAPKPGAAKMATEASASDLAPAEGIPPTKALDPVNALESSPLAEGTPSDEIVVKVKTADGASNNPAEPVFTRSITLGLRGRTPADIWGWFQDRTGCNDVHTSEDDQQEFRTLKEFFIRSAHDREMVKVGMEAVKREKADLERARGEAEKMKAEAV